CRRLDPAPPELELSLAWARGVKTPAITALLEVARQVVGQPRGCVSGGTPADAHADGADGSDAPRHFREDPSMPVPMATCRGSHRASFANRDRREGTAGSRWGRLRRVATEYRGRHETLPRFATCHRQPRRAARAFRSGTCANPDQHDGDRHGNTTRP